MMKMKRCLIVTGGTIDIAFAKDFLSQRSYDYVIAADAGLEVLRPLHISPNAVVGDLDTVDKKVLEEYQNRRIIHQWLKYIQTAHRVEHRFNHSLPFS